MNGDTIITNVEQADQVSSQLADVQIINEIRRLKMNETNWDLMNRDQKEEVLAILRGTTNEIRITDITNALYEVKNKYGLRAATSSEGSATGQSTTDKAARRRARRERRKMQEGTATNGEAATKTIRGGENTLILRNTADSEQVFRFKVRKKGGPKYETAAYVPTTVISINGESVNVIFRPNSETSNRTGFRWPAAPTVEGEVDNSKWYILDDEATKAFFEDAEDNELSFEILEAGTKVKAPAEGTEEAPAASKSRRGKKAVEPETEGDEPEADLDEEPTEVEEVEVTEDEE